MVICSFKKIIAIIMEKIKENALIAEDIVAFVCCNPILKVNILINSVMAMKPGYIRSLTMTFSGLLKILQTIKDRTEPNR